MIVCIYQNIHRYIPQDLNPESLYVIWRCLVPTGVINLILLEAETDLSIRYISRPSQRNKSVR